MFRGIELILVVIGLASFSLFFSVAVNPNLTYSSIGLTCLLVSGILLAMNSFRKKFRLGRRGTLLMVAIVIAIFLLFYAPAAQTAQYASCNATGCISVIQVESVGYYLWCIGAYYQFGGLSLFTFVLEVGCSGFS